MDGKAYHLNELTEESGSDDDDEANMETIYVLLLRR